jgi:hypothetical protein
MSTAGRWGAIARYLGRMLAGFCTAWVVVIVLIVAFPLPYLWVVTLACASGAFFTAGSIATGRQS